MTDYETYSLMVRVLTAVGTFSAVVVALFGERIRGYWARPKLTVTLDSPSLTTATDQDGANPRGGWYYQLRVENKKPFYPTVNVQVLLTRVFTRGPDGLWQEQRFSGPVPVTWRWPAYQPLYETIGANSKQATFGYVLQDSQAVTLQLYLALDEQRDRECT
jgi:hypothetical protein